MATRVLIIGAGKAALAALEEIRRVGSRDEVKLVSMENCPPYSPAALVYLLSGRLTEAALWTKDEDYFRKLGGTLVTGKEVVEILPEKKKVLYHDGSSEDYDTLLVASGSETITPPIEQGQETELYGFKTLVDCRRLLRKLTNHQDVAIWGGGMTAISIAIALLKRGCRVSVIEREQNILPQHFGDEAAVYISEILLEHEARLLAGQSVTGIRRRGEKTRIALSDGSFQDVDTLINATGVKGRVSFLRRTGITMRDGILVDRRMRTTADGIYAAGDVAESEDFFSGKPKINPNIHNAVSQGRVAGANMAGQYAEYEGGISMGALNFFGNTAFSIGFPAVLNRNGRTMKREDHRNRRFRKLIFDEKRLVGGTFINENIDPGLILYLIKRRIDISAHWKALFEGTKPLSDPWLTSLKSAQFR
jgi:phenylglyoxylate dehydrogenase epsilon subunit